MLHEGFRHGNLIQTVLLVAGMLALLALTGWILLGDGGAVWAVAAAGAALLWLPSVSPAILLRMYRARPLRSEHAPAVYHALAELSRRAGLEHLPVLYHIPSTVLNAFTVGSGKHAAIAVSDALLRNLTMRELIAVLAHEVSHIAGADTRVMTLADVVSRVTALFSTAGKILLLLNIPLLLAGEVTVSWLLVVLLILAPHMAMLLQLALSRTREFDADAMAARLSGDPQGLAMALQRLERSGAGLWERMLAPGRRVEEPSFLRTHPPTHERVNRLMAVAGRMHTQGGSAQVPLYVRYTQPVQVPVRQILRPRWRLGGIWY
ncbi:peptidase M48 Ste24p [Oleidesulfovibrio alaskensis G20]|uniref:Peptidase M48 Ste24p n=1 Tax=Oleidesulfovibrio alaskensis (strain ATCC BAA-1058 / DSM 17464 / G20) TaxID=207559 RepID=Q30ZD8_OLEA2|nr:zinc metalloprotease HtpX [Oleidesulfovibrio alaskensis]ABB38958.1 peptidase M48 Ste24p [Oleidesulfovibrio alaskensis G20]MBL3583313.1 M48 family metalloprotease [Oleidesulfovibrio alaskensis]